jgi:hypothetical protein
VSNRQSKKERERRFVEVFKSLYQDFPEGEIIAHEDQERPDAVVASLHGKIGIEITSIHTESLKKEESEIEAVISEAVRIHEKSDLPKLHVGVHVGVGKTFSKKNRPALAAAIARLVAANIPAANGLAEIENDWDDPSTFPYEINSILILRNTALTHNHWNCGSAAIVQEDLADRIQEIISEKESRLSGYDSDCVEQWLLIVGENSSASTFFDPSSSSLSHSYKSVFKKVFFLNSFSRRLSELKLRNS